MKYNKREDSYIQVLCFRSSLLVLDPLYKFREPEYMLYILTIIT